MKEAQTEGMSCTFHPAQVDSCFWLSKLLCRAMKSFPESTKCPELFTSFLPTDFSRAFAATETTSGWMFTRTFDPVFSLQSESSY